ncbi:MAG: CPBP family intramembrane metalloprotease [Eubacterium sp.]|nr:CPBP family intramembrane metalloprotease [Eubacterium sp.]
MKDFIKSLLPLFVSLIITIISYFASFAITVMLGLTRVSDSAGTNVNEFIFNLLRFSLMLIFCGWWFLYIRNTENSENDFVPDKKIKFSIVAFILLIILGFSIQVSTDSLLYILSKAFPDLLVSYHQMIKSFVSQTEPLYLLTIIVLAPIAEELIFRGLTLHYARRACNNIGAAIIFQGVLFGIYHGSIIQGLYAVIFGIMLGVICVRSRSLIPSMFLHMVINGSLYVVYHFKFINVPVAVAAMVISLILLIISFVLVIPRLNSDEKQDD